MRAWQILALAGAAAFVGACKSETVPVAKDPSQSGKEPLPVATGAAATSDGPTGAPVPVVTGEEDRQDWGIMDRDDGVNYARVVDRVANMVTDSDLSGRVRRRGLSLVNVMWEDTGRAQGSALGPNISDFTLQVRRRDPSRGFVSSLMPVIRPPNFVDRTGDVPADKFFVRVGNERIGQSLRSVPLTDVLRDIRSFLSDSSSIGGNGNLLAPRDSHFLVSAQAVFLPIPQKGKAEFNPALFNYQSAPGSPAVLSILITRQGTSVSVIENRPEDASAAVGRGQELYFNNHGERTAFTAERKTDVKARIEAKGGPKTEDDRSALAKGADVLFLVQVPLRHANRGRLGGAMGGAPMDEMAPMSAPAAPMKKSAAPAAAAPARSRGAAAEVSDVEQAVLGHGPNLGPYHEGRGARLERDPQFPVRVTVQFYKATSNGVVSDIDLEAISRSIGSVYEHAEFVGSLVVPEGDPRRPTSWQKIPQEWFPW
ncbi:MAG: hypothetical protein U0235_12210 [Polyangiaceae bacterium]